MQRTILVIDDEADMLGLLKRSLSRHLQADVDLAVSGQAALQKIYEKPYDLVVADIKMPDLDGLSLLALIKGHQPDVTVVMLTAFGSIDLAVKALRQGAYDFITKPFELDALLIRLEKALERSELIRENRRLQQVCANQDCFQELVGKSSAMQQVFDTLEMVAKTDLTVLITGESGTGKNLAARAIHRLSDRRRQPFVAVNCPTVPEQILESELFGYRKGAFTHATQNKTGLFQEAHKGTIFLDEIGEITPTIQTKLLHVLQDKEIKPLGSPQSVRVDVRIIASTNRQLQQRIEAGEFREDFFYRLNVLPVKMPALRERREDIPLIANYLLEKHCRKLNQSGKSFSMELLEELMTQEWTGNVREIENIIIRGILFSRQDQITLLDCGLRPGLPAARSANDRTVLNLPYKEAKEAILQQFNTRYIGQLLMACSGNVTQAARQCGLERQALQQIMRRYAISASDFRE